MDKSFINKFLKGSVATTVGTLASVVLHFISITVMARYTSQEVLGLYFLIIAIANGGKILANLGLDLTLVQFLVSEDKETQQATFAAIIWIRLAVLVLIGAIIYIFGSLLLRQFDSAILPYRWSLPLLFSLMSFRELFFFILQGLQRYRNYAFIQIASAIVRLVLIIALSSMLTLPILIAIEFAMLIVSLAMQAYSTPLVELSPPKMLFDRAIIPKILTFGMPLYANSVFTYISNFGAVFIVGISLNPVSIAAYEVARKIPEGFMRLFTSFRVVYFPSLSSLFAKDDLKNAILLMNRSLVLLGVLVFGVVLVGLLFSYEIVMLVFSEKYLSIQPAFVLLLFAVCMHLLAITMGYSLVSAGHTRQSTMVNIIAMSLELGLSLLLIPMMGYIGAAVSYIIMTLISQIISFAFLRAANAPVQLTAFIKPYLLLFVPTMIYFVAASENFLWRVALLGLYIVLSLVFVRECRDAVRYLWGMREEIVMKYAAKGFSS